MPFNEAADELDNPKKKKVPVSAVQNATNSTEEKSTKEDKTKINPKPEETLAQKK